MTKVQLKAQAVAALDTVAKAVAYVHENPREYTKKDGKVVTVYGLSRRDKLGDVSVGQIMLRAGMGLLGQSGDTPAKGIKGDRDAPRIALYKASEAHLADKGIVASFRPGGSILLPADSPHAGSGGKAATVESLAALGKSTDIAGLIG